MDNEKLKKGDLVEVTIGPKLTQKAVILAIVSGGYDERDNYAVVRFTDKVTQQYACVEINRIHKC